MNRTYDDQDATKEESCDAVNFLLRFLFSFEEILTRYMMRLVYLFILCLHSVENLIFMVAGFIGKSILNVSIETLSIENNILARRSPCYQLQPFPFNVSK